MFIKYIFYLIISIVVLSILNYCNIEFFNGYFKRDIFVIYFLSFASLVCLTIITTILSLIAIKEKKINIAEQKTIAKMISQIKIELYEYSTLILIIYLLYKININYEVFYLMLSLVLVKKMINNLMTIKLISKARQC